MEKSNNFDVKSNEELFKQALVEGVNRRFDREIEEAMKIEQIEEMASMLCGQIKSCTECTIHKPCLMMNCATILYHAGYRKQSEGEWISNELGGYEYAFYCSECGWVDGYPFNDRHKFCPNCGAKMKGGDKA